MSDGADKTPVTTGGGGASLTTILPAAMVVFTIIMAIFGGLSFGFYQNSSTWTGLAFFVGMLAVIGIAVRALRGFFGKFSGQLVFGLWLIAILASYFVFLFKNNTYPMGIDLAGGAELIYVLNYDQADRNIELAKKVADEKMAKDPNSDDARNAQFQVQMLEEGKRTAPDKAAEVVRRRVDPTGTKGIPVTTLGTDRQRLRIQLPKATNEEVERIKRAIQTQGRLNFHIVTKDQDIIEKTKNNPNKISPDGLYEVQVIKKPKKFTEKEEFSEEQIVVKRVPDMDGSHVRLARANRSEENVGQWEIDVRFDAQGGVEFSQLTKANIGKQMAIVLDNIAYSAPVIQEQINDRCRISGSFTQEESEKLAGVLTAGSLPAEVRLESQFVVGPSLGQEQVESGMRAVFIGATIVIMFMLIYYRLGGFIAAFCTLLNVAMLFGAMGFFKATLTLPGIAGIVLTLGMAVDANVLIMERLREELERGRPLRLAVSHGFDRAFLTILDCNLTTLISGIVLYYLGTGPVRGFAVSLSIGILTTLFCNLWLNWIITEWLVSKESIQNLKMMQLFKTPNFDYMAWRKPAMLFTGATAIGSLALFFAVTLNSPRLLDVDFTGGTLIQFNFAKGKEQDSATVKQTVETKIAANLKQKVGDILAKQNIQHVDLTTQTFGEPAAGNKFKSYTITTRITDPSVIVALTEELVTNFKDLEPVAVAAAENNVNVRLIDSPTLTPEVASSRVKGAINETAKDPMFKSVYQPLQTLNVLKTEKEAGGYMLVQLGPLPSDPEQRKLAVNAIEGSKIPERASGPISRNNGFGAQVAGEMAVNAIIALLVANLAVFIYLWFRFEFSGAWGCGAIIALIHDVAVAVGGVTIANLLGFPIFFNLNIVAALLTIIGFSVNDTIVVFDRIREVKAAHPTRSYEEIVNEAVNATLSRTILTSLTVLLSTMALLIFGGPTIQDMAFTLIVGFIAGIYSSVFIAAPLMIWWYRRFGTGRAPVPVSGGTKAAKGDAQGAQI